MRHRFAWPGALLSGVLLSSCLAAQTPSHGLAFELGPSLEIGRAELLFGSVVSVCEDDKGDFYVLDQREQKVHKFSSDGRPLRTFGRKGQGPGDLQSPGRIVFTSQGELAVLEDISYVSFHKTDGAFVRRLDLNGRLGPGYRRARPLLRLGVAPRKPAAGPGGRPEQHPPDLSLHRPGPVFGAPARRDRPGRDVQLQPRGLCPPIPVRLRPWAFRHRHQRPLRDRASRRKGANRDDASGAT